MNPFAWGSNERDQLACGYRGPAQGPVSCTLLRPGVRQLVAVYKGFTIILYEDGSIESIGGGVNGGLGNGSHKDRYLPVKVTLPPCSQIAGDGAHAVALVGGRVAVWGGNSWGTKGDGTSGFGREKGGVATPYIVPGITDAVQIDTAPGLVAVLHADGTVSTWGSGLTGGLGDGKVYHSMQEVPAPVPGCRPQKVPGLTGVRAVACGGQQGSVHCLAVRGSGEVVQWGAKGPCGTPVDVLSPQKVTLPPGKYVAVECGPGQSFAVDDEGNLVAWGSNNDEQLFLPELVTHVPVGQATRVLSGVSAVRAGFQYSYAIIGGVLHASGRNDLHQLGGAGLDGVSYVHCGAGHAVALADHQPLPPILSSVPFSGGAEVKWNSGPVTKPWLISQRPANTGQVFSQGQKLDPSARAAKISAPSGVQTEVRIINGPGWPVLIAEVVPQ